MKNKHDRFLVSLKRSFSSTRLAQTFAFLCAMLLCLQTVSAQQEGAPKMTLEQRYQQELSRWMLQAYEGDRDAQFKVGVLFTNNQFNSADFEQAVYWYMQAARQGHPLSQYNLGHQYLTGIGVKRSETEAMKWWLKAAEQDHPLAQFNVGRGYYLGIGLNEDHPQSEYWFKRAANNNEPKSIDILEQLGWSQPGEYTSAQTTPADNATESTTKTTTDNTEPQPKKEGSSEKQKSETDNAIDSAPAESNKADANTASDSKPDKKTDTTDNNPIAVYTDPSKRAVLIAILNIRNDLEIIEQQAEWTRVRNKSGLPVWVHQDFISVKDAIGVINGKRVNARSVPLIATGSIVGRLDNGEEVTILSQQKQWFRVMSPSNFEAWVKTNDLQAQTSTITSSEKTVVDKQEKPKSVAIKVYDNENDWLFNQPTESYTLQLASFDDPQKTATFESHDKFRNNANLRRFTATSKNIEWTYFLYGAYTDKELAKVAQDEIGQKRAWIRSFGTLQQNRCLAWKKQIPTPKTLNKYCS